MTYDVIIIGAGPAGLSAATTLQLRNKNICVIGNSIISNKVSSAYEINNYLGIPNVKGEQLATNFLEHVTGLGIEVVNKQVNMVYSMGDYFSVQTNDNELLSAKAVIVATGISFGKPYEGEMEFLGRGVSYCATCDAPLYKNKSVVIIGASKKEEHEADFMSEICERVVYIPTYNEPVEVNEKVEVIYDTPIKLQGSFKAQRLVLKEQQLEADGFFVLRDSVPPSQLVPGLKMDGNHIDVNRRMETNIRGLFACGDIVGTPYQYIKAAGEGNVAAISAVEYLRDVSSGSKSVPVV